MTIFTSPIEIIRQSISSITQILAGLSIPVYQEGLKAYVKYDHKGKVSSVHLPYLPDNASDDLIVAVQGFLDHEVGHILFTDATLLKDVAHDPQLSEMQNVLEDPFVEIMMRKRFPGSNQNLNSLYGFFLNKIIDPRVQKLEREHCTNPLTFFATLLPCISRSWAGMEAFTEYLEDKKHHYQPIIDKINLLHPTLIERLGNPVSTKQNIANAIDLLDAVLHVPEGDYSEEEPSLDDDADMSSSGGVTSDAPASRGSSSMPSGIIDVEGGDESDEMPETSEGFESASSESELPEDSSTRPEDDSEPVEGDEDDEPEDDEPEDDELEEDLDLDDLEGDEDADFEDEDELDAKAESKGAEFGDKGDGESLEEVHLGGDGESKEEPEPEPEPEPAKEKMWTMKDGESILDHSVGDMDSCMSDYIEKETLETIKDSEYVIFSTDKDKIEPLRVPLSFEATKSQAEIDSLVNDYIGGMISDLQRTFVSKNKSYWRPGQQVGKINASALSRISVGDMRVFRKKVEHKTQDYDVSLVIDCSGSMHSMATDKHTRIQLALMSAYAMGIALDRIGVNFEIIGFTTKGRYSIPSMPVRVSREDIIYMPIFKSFEERWTPEIWRRIAYFYSNAEMSENVDGECVMIAARRLVAEKSKGKAMIVLSDGSPACTTSDYRKLGTHLKETVRGIESAGVHVVGIGINSNSVKEYYKNHIVLSDISQLPSTVVSEISSIILGG